MARSTLQDWKKRTTDIPLSKSTVEYFESPDGIIFLERLVNVLQFVMTQVGPCGLRLVTLVLRLSDLDYFVASAYETLRERGIAMENAIIMFGDEEKSRLSPTMSSKKISIAEDETFHHKPCLVAIEPVSNFILLEEYSEKRDAVSWNNGIDKALAGLPVEIIQSTSDEARGIVHHVEQHLGAHHSPDIFHVQQEITKGTSAALNSKVRSVQKNIDEIEEALKKRGTAEDCQENRGRPSILSKKTDRELQMDLTALREKLTVTQTQQATIKKAKGDIAESYHPYDLNTGAARSAEQIQQELLRYFDTIEKQANDAQLKQVALDRIKKARRVCSGLVATIVFFWMMVQQFLESLSLTPELEQRMRDILIPAHYLFLASKKAKTSEKRQAIAQEAQQLLQGLQQDFLWKNTEKREQDRLMSASKQCAQLFQRSSSCLEGRNGYLSLRHHGLHHLSNRKLGALTVIHNYFIKQANYTTAAERFFGTKPRDLFLHLIQTLPPIPRPALQAVALRRAA